MDFIDMINKKLVISWPERRPGGPPTGPAPKENILQLKSVFSLAPAEYLEIISQYNGFAVRSKEPSFFMWLFSALHALQTMTDYFPWMITDMPGCFFFGSDGDIMYFTDKHDGRYGVYKVEAAGPCWEDAVFVGNSIKSVLFDGQGWDV